jgi:hypothetical protein
LGSAAQEALRGNKARLSGIQNLEFKIQNSPAGDSARGIDFPAPCESAARTMRILPLRLFLPTPASAVA